MANPYKAKRAVIRTGTPRLKNAGSSIGKTYTTLKKERTISSGSSGSAKTQEQYLLEKRDQLKAAQAQAEADKLVATEKAKAQASYSGKERPAELAARLSTVSALTPDQIKADAERTPFQKLAERRRQEELAKSGKEGELAHYVQSDIGYREFDTKTNKYKTTQAVVSTQTYGEKRRTQLQESFLYPYGSSNMKEPIQSTIKAQAKAREASRLSYAMLSSYPYGAANMVTGLPTTKPNKRLERFENEVIALQRFSAGRKKLQESTGYDKGIKNIEGFSRMVTGGGGDLTKERGVIGGAGEGFVSSLVGGAFYGVGATAQIPEALWKTKLTTEAILFQPDIKRETVSRESRRALDVAIGTIGETVTTGKGIGFLAGAGLSAGIAKTAKTPLIVQKAKAKVKSTLSKYKADLTTRLFKPPLQQRLEVKVTRRMPENFQNINVLKTLPKGQKVSVETYAQGLAARGKLVYKAQSFALRKTGNWGVYSRYKPTYGRLEYSPTIKIMAGLRGSLRKKTIAHELIHSRTSDKFLFKDTYLPESITTRILGKVEGRYVSYRAQPAEIIAFTLQGTRAKMGFKLPETFKQQQRMLIRQPEGGLKILYPRAQKVVATAGGTAKTVAVTTGLIKAGKAREAITLVRVGRSVYGTIQRKGLTKGKYRTYQSDPAIAKIYQGKPTVKNTALFKELGIDIARPFKQRLPREQPITLVTKTGKYIKYKYLNEFGEVVGKARQVVSGKKIKYDRQYAKFYRNKAKEGIGVGKKVDGKEAIYMTSIAQQSSFAIKASQKIFKEGRVITMKKAGLAKSRLVQTDIASAQIELIKIGTGKPVIASKSTIKAMGLEKGTILAYRNPNALRPVILARLPNIKYVYQARYKPNQKVYRLDFRANANRPVTSFLSRPKLSTARKTAYEAMTREQFVVSRYKPIRQARIKIAEGAKIAATKTKQVAFATVLTGKAIMKRNIVVFRKMFTQKKAQIQVYGEKPKVIGVTQVPAQIPLVGRFKPKVSSGLSPLEIIKATQRPTQINLPSILAIPTIRTPQKTRTPTRVRPKIRQETRIERKIEIKPDIEIKPEIRVVPEIKSDTETRTRTDTLITTRTPIIRKEIINTPIIKPETPPPPPPSLFIPKAKRKTAKKQLETALVPFAPKYFASIEATFLNIRGKATKAAIQTGLGLRPIQA